MPGHFSVEELMIDDSFRRYCLHENEADILYWNNYIIANPSEKDKIVEAKQLVLGLSMMLIQEFSKPDFDKEGARDRHEPATAATFGIKRMFRYATAVAAIFALFFVGRKAMQSFDSNPKLNKDIAANTNFADATLFKTSKGEKKLFILPDSTKLWLNAGSELRVDAGFGKQNRQVYLVGEGLFDVTHNEDLPFIVHISKYDIQVLGTLFNVRAYPGDKQSETSLLRGKVEIRMNNSPRRILLVPNQKVVINNLDNRPGAIRDKDDLAKDTAVVLLPLSLSARDNAIIETAWSQNRLEIVDESFADIKEKLERWYNVKISFQDELVGKYRFSATFKNETIQQVLHALENAYPFKYEIHGNEVILSK